MSRKTCSKNVDLTRARVYVCACMRACVRCHACVYQEAISLRFRMVLRGTIHKLFHFQRSLLLSADSTANKNVTYLLSYVDVL